MSNVKITDLSELTTANNSNTIFLVADVTSGNTSHFIRLGTFTPSPYDYTLAQNAYAQANTSFSVGYQANVSFNRANTAWLAANNAYSTAFFANSSFLRANASFIKANSGYDTANSAEIFANGAFTRANTSVIKTGDTITGIILAPTASPGTSNTMISTTAFVQTSVQNATGSLGTMSTQNFNTVAITGGTISGATVNGVTVGSNASGNKTISTSAPSGGSNGDVWYRI